MKMPKILWVMLLCTPLASEAAESASLQRGGAVTETDSATARGPNETKPSRAPQTARSRTVPGEDTGAKTDHADDRQSPRPRPETSVGSTSGNPGAATSQGRGSAAPQRGMGQVARPNADRLRALLNAQARGRLARQPGRSSVGPRRAAIDGRRTVLGRRGGGQVSPTPVASGPTAGASGPATVASGSAAGASRPATVASGSAAGASGPANVASGAAAAASGPTAVASGLTPATSNSGARAAMGPSAVTRAIGRGTAIGGPRAPGVGLVGGPATGRIVHSAMVDGTQFRRGH
jgi:hypothetical protein